MLKKLLSLIILSFVLTGCPSTKPTQVQKSSNPPVIFKTTELQTVSPDITPIYEPIGIIRENVAFISPTSTTPQRDDITQIAIFLPLTGNGQKVGQSMKKAFQLSFSTADIKKLKYQFFDTGSTPDGTMKAYQEAGRYNIDLILGPVFSNNVRTLAPLTNVPIISFTTDSNVLSSNVYSLGLLQEEEVRNLKSFVSIENAGKMVAFLPNNAMGRIYGRELENYNMPTYKVIYYTPNNIAHIEDQIKITTNYAKRKSAMDTIKRGLSTTSPEYKKYENFDTSGDVDFDSVLIIGDINDSKLIVSYLRYFEVDPKKVNYYGTSIFGNTKILTDPNFINVNFVNLSQKRKQAFEDTYKARFNEMPETLSYYAYDAGKIAQYLSRNGYFEAQSLTASGGFNGINGTFRLLPDGKSQYLMELLTILGRDNVKIKQTSTSDFR